MGTQKIECMYCGEMVAATSARSYTCPRCWKTNIEQFGAGWHLEEWHTKLLPEAERMVNNPNGITGMTNAMRKQIEFVNIDHTIEQIAADVESVQPKMPTVSHKNEIIHQAIYELYVTQKLGWRRIRKELLFRGIMPLVSEATIKRYLADVKREVEEVGHDAA